MRLTPLVLATALATPAFADITVRFVEGAPKDRFVIEAEGCPVGPHMLTIDLSETAAGLIFDTTATGAGVEVYQPFEIAVGAEHVAHTISVGDGETVIGLAMMGLEDGDQVAFTIDVDDTALSSELGQTRVSDSEILGAEVRMMTSDGKKGSAMFDAEAFARIPVLDCMS